MMKKLGLALLVALFAQAAWAQTPNYPGALYTYTAPSGACNPPTQTAGCITNTMFNQLAKEVQALETTLDVVLGTGQPPSGLNDKKYSLLSTADRMRLGLDINPTTPAIAALNVPDMVTDPITVSDGDIWIANNLLHYRSGGNTISIAPGAGSFLGLSDTPDSYSGQGGRGVRVNPGESGLEFYTIGAGAGTVTSVDVTVPSGLLSIGGNPITTSGTLAFSLVNQNANLVLAGPTTGSPAAPTFRSLVAADIPNLDAGKITSGTIATARLGSGTANNTTYLRGDQTYATPPGGGSVEVKETDGSPDVTGVSIIQVSPGSLTDNGGGNVSIATGGGGSGDNISVNGTDATNADFDDATPAAAGSGVNVKWQKDTSTPNNISAYVQDATGSQGGAVTSAAQTFGGKKTFNGGVVVGDGSGNDVIESIAESSNPSCTSGKYYIWANSSDLKLKKCQNGTITDLDTQAAGGNPVWNVLTKTADYTILSGDITGKGVIVVCSTGSVAITLTLPAANAIAGGEVGVKREGANTCTVTRAGSDTIYDTSSVTSKTLTSDGQMFEFIADGTSAWIEK